MAGRRSKERTQADNMLAEFIPELRYWSVYREARKGFIRVKYHDIWPSLFKHLSQTRLNIIEANMRTKYGRDVSVTVISTKLKGRSLVFKFWN